MNSQTGQGVFMGVRGKLGAAEVVEKIIILILTSTTPMAMQME